MSVMMILQGGNLDGQRQVVENLPHNPGDTLLLNLPHKQTFDDNGLVIDTGLVTTYGYLQDGNPPGSDDVWSASYIYQYVS